TIVFLRKILPQAADRSYGIQVAKLAGLPQEVLARAREILQELEGGKGSMGAPEVVREAAATYEAVAVAEQQPAKSSKSKKAAAPTGQLSLFATEENPIIDELRKLDVMRLTPLDAMNYLYKLHQKARGSE
ncbi:MAG TPA: DNA mismatch repair protein MutS, partial [Bacilli bacterium]|nr:DNA mismatch repair protein MutS [Bacilli bacterium]